MEYVSRFLQLVELERKAEIKRHRDEMTLLTARERQSLGRCEFYLSGKKAPSVFHYTVIKYSKDRPLNTRMSVGDLVLVSRGNPLESEVSGTITSVSKFDITVAFENAPPRWAFGSSLRLDLYSNDMPYRRM